MPPRIAYWTSAFEPGMEAIANEVAALRTKFPRSVVWGLSHRHWMLFSWRRGYCLNPRLHLVFRAITRALEPAFQLNHVFGSIGDWFYLEGFRQRPVILTMAAVSQPVAMPLLHRVDRFVVEYPRGIEDVTKLGIEKEKIRLIFPPVDLVRYSPSSCPAEPFTVLFASGPDQESWLKGRGVPQILDAAALRPRMRFRLLWRPWGNSLATVKQWVKERDLSNVELQVGRVADMASEYRTAHVTIAPFINLHHCKPVPNSLLESLASGRPVITTSQVGIADTIQEDKAGQVCQPTGQGIAEALDRIRADWPVFARKARALAVRRFGAERFLHEYERLYSEFVG